MTDVSLRQLEYFCAVGVTGSLAAAAEECRVSVSSISTSLTQLERAVGTDLAVRSRRHGTVLTSAGRELFVRAKGILAAVESLPDLTADGHELHGTLRIGVTVQQSAWLVPPILDHFLQAHPGVAVAVHEDAAEALPHQVRRGVLDACLGNEHHGTVAGTNHTRLAPIGLSVAVARDNPLAELAEASLADLRPYEGIMLDRPGPVAAVERICAAAGVDLSFRWRIQRPETILALVQRGLGYAILNRAVVESSAYESRIAFVPLREAPVVGWLALSHRAAARPDAAVVELIRFCREHFGRATSDERGRDLDA